MRLTNLDYLKLMSDGDRDMEQTMLEILLTELPEEFNKMKSLFAEQQWEGLSKVSHKMKSTLAFIGNADMTNANLKIEQLTKQKDNPPIKDDVEVIADMMVQFEGMLPAVLEELNQAFESY